MTGSQGQYSIGLDKTPANYVPLSPLSFLERSAAVYPHLTSAVYEDRRFTWAETFERCRRVASFLRRRGVVRGDTVATMLPNIPAMNELHFAVPMADAVLNTLNTRLDPAALAFMLDHGGAKIVFVDPEFGGAVAEALGLMTGPKPLVVDVDDAAFTGGQRIGEIEYEAAVASGDPDHVWAHPQDEWDAIALSYTSGTTGDPKGVVTHHRGAYLNAVSNVLAANLGQHPVYLWTLPMFHCNGWCFPWTIAATAGINVCLRKVDPTKIFALIERHGVTHMSGAPIVYNTLINAPDAPRGGAGRSVSGLIAGAAPPVAVLAGAENIGIRLTHVYGLTEVYGPASVCAEHEGWDALPADQRAQLKRRQGVPYPLQEAVTVIDPETMQVVPRDGETIGEVMFRGNIVMKGYLKNEKATEAAFAGGWFHTGDLGVLDQDGYVIIKDRSKDIIISGGENISSVEVEDVLYKHPAVLFAAVVAKPDSKWGEVPCAFVELKAGAKATEAEIIAYCREHLPGFKTPKAIVFGELPKTSTGKIQKFVLRNQVGSASAITA
ncbi:acyl-CoA synthetase [Bradyrhizobium sp. U87765 SZCCT0131]|uniref:acyl-CoA synthetase n=1 Tax=unclassified Bradyrhizobium TaxID=2631580 RepID=UPI001BA4B094|nr:MULTISPECIES: acyl-CoA synthetase [unclassified Bradyrhizobium]MBR1220209.1 acyl-CoA synthetase [Bradyrhizobium sp. U87765 SZCCT0131]MBR1263335.1 acyl-CoA synthetase [Bradyrhizobium sp. U87765 SZCCT0134]MBR1306782.1 acyl-CoA synthetase [Bradyrhizobium sp. U87765 SZCCT0110]MBR1323281.1 acyl-CoA synthetase [Bradyrhizobium sp. U87765 SZCCT0109]MBR1345736.1 acyl-CoA synthetase [Bradyrhizobium sp. U87765 SZCCT0048]